MKLNQKLSFTRQFYENLHSSFSLRPCQMSEQKSEK